MHFFTSCLALLDIRSNHAPLQRALASGKKIIKKMHVLYVITKPDKSLSRYLVILCKLSLQYTKPKLSLKFSSFVKILNRAFRHRKLHHALHGAKNLLMIWWAKSYPKVITKCFCSHATIYSKIAYCHDVTSKFQITFFIFKNLSVIVGDHPNLA